MTIPTITKTVDGYDVNNIPNRGNLNDFETNMGTSLTYQAELPSDLNELTSQINTAISSMNTDIAQANADASTASNAATTATEQAAIATTAAGSIAVEFTATSTTSVTIGTGTKSFAIETGKAFIVGQSVRIVSDSNISNYMIGQISTAIDGNIWVSVTTVGGSGVFSDWSISLVNLSPSDFKTVGGESIVGVGNIATLVIDYQEFSSSGVCTIPSGASYAYIEAIAAGGSGSRGSNGGGGGAGEYFAGVLPVSLMSASETVTIGAGGAAVSSDLNGNDGGSTSFGSLLNLRGGFGGANTLFSLNRKGESGFGGAPYYISSNRYRGSSGSGGFGQDGQGGNSTGAGGGAGCNSSTIYVGGVGNLFGNGGNSSISGTAQSGGIGAGGGGTYTGTSGAGGDGFLRIWFW